ncbi:hypothetical protein FR773_25725 (plasmid) [Leclercia adecarboxylata]|uniref:hypothetical protein n=1 Tax=Leclercia adecarboxylata TaxID=83655 RepID=UPI0012A9A11E|nr:hypothetical protein [Leclercia adecarboxylata]QFH68043.1 hypothetical protein FR773_25725 [Leclercia adecarboxylata]
MAGFTKEQLIERIAEQKKTTLSMLEVMPQLLQDALVSRARVAAEKDLQILKTALAALTVNPTPAPELKMAELINKFYERYPLETFKSDTERSAALDYFMAGAELQCFGVFINYADLAVDE